MATTRRRRRAWEDTPTLRQALFVVPLLLNVVLMVGGGLVGLGPGDPYLWAVVAVALASVLAVASMRTVTLGRWVWLVPITDMAALGAMRLEEPNGGVAVLVVLPAMWLGVDYRLRGVAAAAIVVMATLTLPTLAYFGTGADPWSRALLLPAAAVSVAVVGAALSWRWTLKSHELAIKHEELEQTFEQEQQVAARQEVIASTIDVGLVMIDRQGTYTSLNPKQRQILAVAYPDGHEGRAGQEGLVFGEDRTTPVPREGMPTVRALRGERFSDYLLWIGEPGGHQRAVSVSASPMFDPTGVFDGAVLAYKDVTDLMTALTVKDDFVATVSHELRTPLTSIMGFLDLVIETDAGLSDTTRTQLGIVKRNSERLLRLVSDLLLAAQTEDGSMTLNLRLHDVAGVVDQAIAEVAPMAAEGAVLVTTDLQRPVRAMVDEGRLRQVVDNLVSNAVKYTPAGGQVEVSLALVGDAVRLEVADTGIGITAEDQEQLFTRFFRAREAEDLAIQGAGLGLSITKAIVEAHGGTIEVSSSPGEGTRFVVTLPTGFAPA